MPKKHIIAADIATKIRRNAEPVIEWLRSAEEESSSDEDEVEVQKLIIASSFLLPSFSQLGGLF